MKYSVKNKQLFRGGVLIDEFEHRGEALNILNMLQTAYNDGQSDIQSGTHRYKIKAEDGGRGPTLEFEIEADTLVKAREAAQAKLKSEGFPYAKVEKITELGPEKGTSPAKIIEKLNADIERLRAEVGYSLRVVEGDPVELFKQAGYDQCVSGHPNHEPYTPSGRH